jgi:gamma-glutamylputrescine oxidase
MSYFDAVAVLGEQEARSLWDFTLQNNRQMADLVKRHRIDCGFLRRGSMSLAVSEEEMDVLRRCEEDLASAGISTAVAERAQLPVPFDELYAGGLYYPGNGEMNSGLFCRGVAEVLGDSMAICERSPVRGLTHDGVWRLETTRGTVRADAVILATNAYTSRLLPEVPVSPTRGQVLATSPLPAVIVPFPMYAKYGYQYWRQTVDGRLVVGGWRDVDIPTETGMEERLHEAIQQHLLDFAHVVAGNDVPIEYRWAGIMGFTPDQFPLVGPVHRRPGLFLSVGYSGHGVSMAFTCGGLAARAALGSEVSIPPAFAPGRFLSPVLS